MNNTCSLQGHSDFASKQPLTFTINGAKRTFPTDTLFRIESDMVGNYNVSAVVEGEEDIVEFQVPYKDMQCAGFTPIEFSEDANGELVAEYIQEELVAGKKKAVKKKKSGTTNCYRFVKAFAKKKYGITLTGIPAYTAAAQLKALGFKKTTIAKAPIGAICVYNKGGKPTASGGQKYGHIEMRKSCGWDYGYGCKPAPLTKALGRPFIGCYYK
jgi:hypothetical protein